MIRCHRCGRPTYADNGQSDERTFKEGKVWCRRCWFIVSTTVVVDVTLLNEYEPNFHTPDYWDAS